MSEAPTATGRRAGQSSARLRGIALRRAARLRGLYIHALAFVLGNATNVVVNWLTLGDGTGRWWFQWALIAWTVALGVHAITVLGNGVWFGTDWEERKVRQYLHQAAQRREPMAERATARGDD